jgi:hypothetical protein
VCFALKVCYWNCCEICHYIGNWKLSNHRSRTAIVQACGVANIYRVEDRLHLATGKNPTSLSATYELSPCRHHHDHQAATIIYSCSLRRSGHPLSVCVGVYVMDRSQGGVWLFYSFSMRSSFFTQSGSSVIFMGVETGEGAPVASRGRGTRRGAVLDLPVWSSKRTCDPCHKKDWPF